MYLTKIHKTTINTSKRHMNPAEKAAEVSHHLEPLISDLGLILMTAGIAVLLFRKLKQPLVLGYLIAGFLAGNHFDFFSFGKRNEKRGSLGRIGVIFLLFSLGLEFSFKKLMKVGGTASITAGVQIVSMCILGYAVGQWMDWTKMDSIFLGVILSISSTTIILKSFEELGVKTQKFAGIVIGSLIVQDILAILMMVLLSTVAVSSQFSGTDLLMSVLKLVFFLVIWFLGGIFIIPTVLKKTKHLLTDEMLLIISLALCLTMVGLAANVGFSLGTWRFYNGLHNRRNHAGRTYRTFDKTRKRFIWSRFFRVGGNVDRPRSLVRTRSSCLDSFLCHHFWAIHQFHFWCFTIGATLERFHPNRDGLVTNWGVLFYHSNFGNDIESHQCFFISDCRCSLGRNGIHDSVYDQIFASFL